MIVRTAAAAVAAVLLAACSGGGSPRTTSSPTHSPTPLPSTSPSASRTPSPAKSPPRSPSPSPSPTPKPTGTPVGTAGTALRVEPAGTEVVDPGKDCTEAYPDLFDVSCDDVKLDGGSVRWVAGTDAGRWTLRLLAFSEPAGGYVPRFRADDPDGSWAGFRLGAAALTGHGTDGLVVATVHAGADARRSYDVLTWRRGGPLVLRAHRPALKQGRVLIGKDSVEEYEGVYSAGEQPCCPSRYVRRKLAWDGRRFLIATLGAVGASRVPAAD